MPRLVLADFAWPGLLFTQGYWSWWVVLVGLAIEYFVVWKVFELAPSRAIRADLVMNGLSASLGMVVVAIADFGWQFSLGQAIFHASHRPEPVVATWGPTAVFSILVSTVVEVLVLYKVFKARVTRNRVAILALANAITVTLAFLEMYRNPIRL